MHCLPFRVRRARARVHGLTLRKRWHFLSQVLGRTALLTLWADLRSNARRYVRTAQRLRRLSIRHCGRVPTFCSGPSAGPVAVGCAKPVPDHAPSPAVSKGAERVRRPLSARGSYERRVRAPAARETVDPSGSQDLAVAQAAFLVWRRTRVERLAAGRQRSWRGMRLRALRPARVWPLPSQRKCVASVLRCPLPSSAVTWSVRRKRSLTVDLISAAHG